MVKLNCTQCGKEFESESRASPGLRRFCSKGCRTANTIERKKGNSPVGFEDNVRFRQKAQTANDLYLKALAKSGGAFADALVLNEPLLRDRPVTQTGCGASSAAWAAGNGRSSGRSDNEYREMPPEIALAPLRSLEAR